MISNYPSVRLGLLTVSEHLGKADTSMKPEAQRIRQVEERKQ